MSMERNPGAKSIKAWKQSHKHGSGEWLMERFSSFALLPLVAWLMYAGYQLAGTSFEQKVAFVRQPASMSVLGLLIVIAVWHGHMGLRVIIDDYFPKGAMRGLLGFLAFFVMLAVVAAGVGALYLLAKGA